MKRIVEWNGTCYAVPESAVEIEVDGEMVSLVDVVSRTVDDAVETLNAAKARIEMLEREVETERGARQSLRQRLTDMERRSSDTQELLAEKVKDEEIEAEVAQEIADALGVSLTVKEEMTVTLDVRVTVEWEPSDGRPEPDDIASELSVEHGTHEVDWDYSNADWQ
jgi:predicted  nucleic acid-binding Zn-ribbon protein